MSQAGQTFVLTLLRAYKWALSPLLPPACRYVPPCSDYAMEAVDRFGLGRGGLMAMVRILRCHPFAKGGCDPVMKCGTYGDSAGATSPAARAVTE